MNYRQYLSLTIMPLLLPAMQTDDSGIPWWVYLIIILVLLFLVLIVVLRQQEPGPPIPKAPERPMTPPAPAPSVVKEEPKAPEEPDTPEPAAPAEEAEPAAPVAEERSEKIDVTSSAEEVKPDDLKVVEGIGPKISSVLQEAGIATYAALAEANAEQLKGILDAANIRLGDPTTWPEQARLAAEGKWDDLEALQDSLKGGRRT